MLDVPESFPRCIEVGVVLNGRREMGGCLILQTLLHAPGAELFVLEGDLAVAGRVVFPSSDRVFEGGAAGVVFFELFRERFV